MQKSVRKIVIPVRKMLRITVIQINKLKCPDAKYILKPWEYYVIRTSLQYKVQREYVKS